MRAIGSWANADDASQEHQQHSLRHRDQPMTRPDSESEPHEPGAALTVQDPVLATNRGAGR
jgi:hypothetical protein